MEAPLEKQGVERTKSVFPCVGTSLGSDDVFHIDLALCSICSSKILPSSSCDVGILWGTCSVWFDACHYLSAIRQYCYPSAARCKFKGYNYVDVLSKVLIVRTLNNASLTASPWILFYFHCRSVPCATLSTMRYFLNPGTSDMSMSTILAIFAAETCIMPPHLCPNAFNQWNIFFRTWPQGAHVSHNLLVI